MFPPAARLAILWVAGSLAIGPRFSYAQWRVNGAPVCNGTNDQIAPQIASDGAGGGIITWKDHRGFNNDIWAQRVNAGGVAQWATDGVAICTGNGEHDLPVIVADGVGGAIIAWKDHRGSNYDIYAQRVNTGGVPQWTPDGVVVCNGNGEHDYPAIASDGAGGAIITWVDYSAGDNTSDIYAQRMSAGGVAQWTAQGVPICGAAGSQLLPDIAADGVGGAIIAWCDRRIGGTVGGTDVYAQRVNAGGVAQWTANGVGVCIATGEQASLAGPQLVEDGTGGAIICWEDDRNLNYDIYAQHVQASGAADPGWPANGTLLCQAPSGQDESQIVSDGAGGAIVTWYDNRSAGSAHDTGGDIYAQHVQASGAVDPAWTGNGTLLCDAADLQQAPMIASDGAGGAIVAWQDRRNGTDNRIYAQHVPASGTVDPAWTANGTLLCSAGSNLLNSQIVADGTGGAIVAWGDHHNGTDYDIYAQRVYGGGGVAAVPPERVAQFSVRAPHPNPAHAGATISLYLPAVTRVSVSVYDVSGRFMRALAMDREFPPGRQDLEWDGTSDVGVPVTAGVYIVGVTAGGTSVARRVAILR